MFPDQPRGSGHRTVLWSATALVFLSSVFVMTLEIVAARLVAQHLGVSLYTWTAVIGVVLAGITAGNYVGGKLADLYPPRALLTSLFLLSSVACLSVLFIVDWMGSWERPEYLSWPLWILRNVALAFLAPSGVLGTITPVAARFALSAREQLGATVGTLYAAGAAGSIVGTFATGYVLIDAFGSKAIVCAVAAGLALLGLLVGLGLRRSPHGFFVVWLGVVGTVSALTIGPWPWAREIGAFVGLRFATDHLHYQDESAYFAIEIYDAEELDDTRILALDHLVHSYVAMGYPGRLEYAYETVYAAVTERLLAAEATPDVFFIGGGGYTFPRWMESRYPRARIDVAEIDPAVKRAAQAALGLPADDATLITTHAMDARNYVDDVRRRNRHGAEALRYDLVFGDAFNDLGVPYHLTTQGFNERLVEVLQPDGVYLVNVIDVFREGYGRFLGAFVNTALRTFPYVYVFSGEAQGTSEDRDTFVVVSSRRALPIMDLDRQEPAPQGFLFAWSEGGRHGGDMETLLSRGAGLVLTDDHAPVDNLLAPVFSLQEEP